LPALGRNRYDDEFLGKQPTIFLEIQYRNSCEIASLSKQNSETVRCNLVYLDNLAVIFYITYLINH
jgi:hypothetical protein